MKNVWILERFVPVEEIRNQIDVLINIMNTADAEEAKQTARQFQIKYEEDLKKYPNGYWMAYTGKINYNEFCYCAKDFMKRHENDLVKTGVRAVKAEIPEDVKYWVGYKNPKVNEKVTAYLYATYKYM